MSLCFKEWLAKPSRLILWILFLGATVAGIFLFKAPTAGTIELPITEGDEAGIYLEHGFLSFEQLLVEEAGASHRFTPLSESPNAITNADNIQAWLRLPLSNLSDGPQEYILQLNSRWIQLVTFYSRNSDGTYTETRQGRSLRPSPGNHDSASPAFVFSLAAGESQVLFLKLQDSFWVDPTITIWDDPIAFYAAQALQQRFFYGYIGLIIGLFFTNLYVFIAFSYADLRAYLLYLVATLLLHSLNFGYDIASIYELFDIDTSFHITPSSFYLFSGMLLLNGGLLLLFTNEFLNLKKSHLVSIGSFNSQC